MQMPGGHQDVSFDRLSLDERQERARRRRKVSTGTGSARNVQERQNGGDVRQPSSPTNRTNSSLDSVDAPGFGYRPLHESEDADSGSSAAAAAGAITSERGRSKVSRIMDAVGKPFVRVRSKSVGPRTTFDTSVGQIQSLAPNTPDLNRSLPMDDRPSVHHNASARRVGGHALTWFGDGRIPGVIGIRNHGNTCFMNAVIQCLSNIEHFAEFFVTDQCSGQILEAQRSGRTCVITQEFAQLLTSIWTCEYSAENSARFKEVIGSVAGQYSGSDQNDAQEFLQWLLDHIHEELYGSGSNSNKSNNKTAKSTSKQKDNVNGDNTNLGIVYDLFLAQFRSTLTCPSCNKHSCKYEPFLLMTLPIPEKYKIPVNAIIVPRLPRTNLVKVGVLMSTSDMVSALRSCVAARSGISIQQLILIQISKSGNFMRVVNDGELMSDVEAQLDDLYAVEGKSNGPDIVIIAVNVAVSNGDIKRIGNPFVLQVSREVTSMGLRRKLVDTMRGLFKDSAASQLEEIMAMFRMRLVCEQLSDPYLPEDVELPLYATDVDEALSGCHRGDGPQHIKMMVEWDYTVSKRWISHSGSHMAVLDDPSVKQVKSEIHQSSAASLDDCFSVFTQQERLGASDKWYCSNCRHHQSGTIKTLSLSSLPDVMVIQLKRFKQGTEDRVKLNALIRFPLVGLDMSRHLEKPANVNNNDYSKWHDDCIYDLCGVCNHFGDMMSGHYTAYCKNPLNDQWYNFDDVKVYKLRSDSVVTKHAYLLFYRRRTSETRCDVTLQGWIAAVCGAMNGGSSSRSFDTRPPSETRPAVTPKKNARTTEHNFTRQTYATSSAHPARSAHSTTLVPSNRALQHLIIQRAARNMDTTTLYNMLKRPQMARPLTPLTDPRLSGWPNHSRARTRYNVHSQEPLPVHAQRVSNSSESQQPPSATNRALNATHDFADEGKSLAVSATQQANKDRLSVNRQMVKSKTESDIDGVLNQNVFEPKLGRATTTAAIVTRPKLVFEKVIEPSSECPPLPPKTGMARKSCPLQESSV